MPNQMMRSALAMPSSHMPSVMAVMAMAQPRMTAPRRSVCRPSVAQQPERMINIVPPLRWKNVKIGPQCSCVFRK